MPAFARRQPSSTHSAPARRISARRARVEQLEPRWMMYAASGYKWASPNVSFSYVPDGAKVEGYDNTLFAALNAIAPTAVWQREFARALQTWANASNLNFFEVADAGLASGTSGSAQGDSRFGDIRLAMHALGGPLAYAYFPSGGSNTITGDIFLATEHGFQINSTYDLFSVLLHEAGHSLGLNHVAGTVMNSSYQGVLSGLTADDIAGIQAIYGARQHDAFDAAASNNTLATATLRTVGSDGKATATADLQSLADVDYYAFAAPATADGSFTVTVSTNGISLLAPRVAVYNSAGQQVGSATAGYAYSSKVQVSVSGVAPGERLYVMADGAADDAFGMGKYQIQAAFGVTGGGDPEPPPPPPPPPAPTADRYEPNDALGTATNLGRFNSKSVADVSLHTATDLDFYRFTAQKSGTFQITARLDGGSAAAIAVYNASGALIAQSGAGTVNVTVGSGVTTYVRLQSASGTVDMYDLAFARIGNANQGRQTPGNLEPDFYFATAEEVAVFHSQHDHHGEQGKLDASAATNLAARADTGRAIPSMRERADFGCEQRSVDGAFAPSTVTGAVGQTIGHASTSLAGAPQSGRRSLQNATSRVSPSQADWAAAVDMVALALLA